ncbi:MAG: D-cysteine desulfhydrase family protein [Filifactor alocis]|nr:D-cysteine desulfhydrase family protein [Filifactor alocis]
MNKLHLANLPTPIVKLERLSKETGIDIYMKRDDYTGLEVSGNKVRKLEYSFAEAISLGCNHVITCGGIQSNHARATAMVARRLGMSSTMVLRGREEDSHEGNPFLSRMIGSDFHFITAQEYRDEREDIMKELAKGLEKKGKKAYLIPEGASNAVGSLGYRAAYEEICMQEETLGLHFDRILLAVGSGGTYAGLNYANLEDGRPLRITGINICDDADFFRHKAASIIEEMNVYTKKEVKVRSDELQMIDGYVGAGYAISREEELRSILHVARTEAVVLDPVYTGKAMHGLLEEIKKGSLRSGETILFVHTGGMFGWTKEKIKQLEELM